MSSTSHILSAPIQSNSAVISEQIPERSFIGKISLYFYRVCTSIFRVFKRVFCIPDKETKEDLQLQNHLMLREKRSLESKFAQEKKKLQDEISALKIDNRALNKSVEILKRKYEIMIPGKNITLTDKIAIEMVLLPFRLIFLPLELALLPWQIIKAGVYDAVINKDRSTARLR